MICVWLKSDPVLGHFCAACGRWWKRSAPAELCRRTCRKEEPKRDPRDCIHHGNKIGERQCETCAGRVMVFIFECGLLGKCSDKKKFGDVAGCEKCGRFQSSIKHFPPLA